MNKAVFPGSFDPFTRGHESIVRRACLLFDEVIIGIGTNTTKQYMYSQRDRMAMIERVFASEPKVTVKSFDGLTVDFCKLEKAQFILRGIRDGKDFFYEQSISIMNQQMAPDIETIFLITEPRYSGISSTILREIVRNDGDIGPFVPEGMMID